MRKRERKEETAVNSIALGNCRLVSCGCGFAVLLYSTGTITPACLPARLPACVGDGIYSTVLD